MGARSGAALVLLGLDALLTMRVEPRTAFEPRDELPEPYWVQMVQPVYTSVRIDESMEISADATEALRLEEHLATFFAAITSSLPSDHDPAPTLVERHERPLHVEEAGKCCDFIGLTAANSLNFVSRMPPPTCARAARGQRILGSNYAAKSSCIGKALRTGLLRCRRCGRMLQVAYGGGYPKPRYSCRRGRQMHGTAPRICFGAGRVYATVGGEILLAVAQVDE